MSKLQAEVALWVVCIVIGALCYAAQVRENDLHLEAVARCADSAQTTTGVEWKAAWNACWKAL